MLKTAENLIDALRFLGERLELKKKKVYGTELILELFGCDMISITCKERIQEFIDGICREINMEKYGSSLIKRFPGGETFGEGYSFFQFITTSSITGHFIEKGGIAFINIFSCKQYDAVKAAKFTEKFFWAKKIKSQLVVH